MNLDAFKTVNFDAFKTENWSKLPINEKYQALQEFENAAALSQGRIARIVYPDSTLESNVCGYYSPNDKNYLYINPRMLEADQFDLMNTVLHEGRHAFQDDVINGRIANSGIDPDTVDLWAHNRLNGVYIFDEDDPQYSYTNYYVQPIEDDAEGYAVSTMNSLSSYFSDDPAYSNYLTNLNDERQMHLDSAATIYGEDYQNGIAEVIQDRYDNLHSQSQNNRFSIDNDPENRNDLNSAHSLSPPGFHPPGDLNTNESDANLNSSIQSDAEAALPTNEAVKIESDKAAIENNINNPYPDIKEDVQTQLNGSQDTSSYQVSQPAQENDQVSAAANESDTIQPVNNSQTDNNGTDERVEDSPESAQNKSGDENNDSVQTVPGSGENEFHNKSNSPESEDQRENVEQDSKASNNEDKNEAEKAQPSNAPEEGHGKYAFLNSENDSEQAAPPYQALNQDDGHNDSADKESDRSAGKYDFLNSPRDNSQDTNNSSRGIEDSNDISNSNDNDNTL